MAKVAAAKSDRIKITLLFSIAENSAEIQVTIGLKKKA
jgi:hypothetical protein